MNRRLIYLILGTVLVVAGFAGLVYWAKRVQDKTANNQPPTSKIIKVIDDRIVSAVPSLDGNAIWYFTISGHLFRVDSRGDHRTEAVLPKLPGDITQVLWPTAGSAFILHTLDSNMVAWNYYNDLAQTFTALADNVQAIEWMPDGKRILYIWRSGDNVHQTLVMANADGTGYVTIGDVPMSDMRIKVSPDGKQALLYRPDVTSGDRKLYLADLIAKKIDTVGNLDMVNGALWLPSQHQILYGVNPGIKYPHWYLYDLDKKSAQDMKIVGPQDKLLVDPSGSFLYAAFPRPSNKGDSFVKVDLSTGKQESFYEPEEVLNLKNLMMLGHTLYFINQPDNHLYYLDK